MKSDGFSLLGTLVSLGLISMVGLVTLSQASSSYNNYLVVKQQQVRIQLLRSLRSEIYGSGHLWPIVAVNGVPGTFHPLVKCFGRKGNPVLNSQGHTEFVMTLPANPDLVAANSGVDICDESTHYEVKIQPVPATRSFEVHILMRQQGKLGSGYLKRIEKFSAEIPVTS